MRLPFCRKLNFIGKNYFLPTRQPRNAARAAFAELRVPPSQAAKLGPARLRFARPLLYLGSLPPCAPCQAASAADLSSGSLSFLALAALRPLGGLAAFRAFAARHPGRPGETCPAAHDVHVPARAMTGNQLFASSSKTSAWHGDPAARAPDRTPSR
jgi:hypothetical protein